MPNTKISALTAASALAGTEVLPVVQSSATVGATVQQVATAITGATGMSGATETTSKPLINLAQTWNAAGVTFTGIKSNITSTASAAASLLQDWQVGGTSMASVRKDGLGSFGDAAGFNSPNLNLRFSSGAGAIIQLNGASAAALSSNFGFAALKFSLTSAITSTPDVFLDRDAAYTLAQRAGTNAQTFRVYNTYTDASNYERITLSWVSNVAYLTPQNAGTGSARLLMVCPGSTTVASLPAAATAGNGARGYVTDANTTMILGYGTAVVGGGANHTPVVVVNGAWVIG